VNVDFKGNDIFSHCLHRSINLYSTLSYFSIKVASTTAAIMKSDFKHTSTETSLYKPKLFFRKTKILATTESDNFKLCDSTVTNFFQYL